MQVSHRISVGAIVVSWENGDATLECMQSLRQLTLSSQQCEVDLQVVLVDNGSGAAIVEHLQNWLQQAADPRLSLLHTEQNGGYAYGGNRGIRHFLDGDTPDYLWLLNNDVRLDSGSLLALVTAAELRPEIVLWGSTIVRADGTDLLECAGGYTYSPLTTRVVGCHSGRSLGDAAALTTPDMDYICGASMFSRAQLFEQVGLLCEDYFLYFEEYDLVLRLPEPAQIAWCPGSIVYHRGGASTSQAQQLRSPMQQYYENLSTLKFTARFFSAYLPLVFGLRLLLKPLLFLVRREWHLYRPFFAAYREFVFPTPPTGPGAADE